jgi:hypothetical protein
MIVVSKDVKVVFGGVGYTRKREVVVRKVVTRERVSMKRSG